MSASLSFASGWKCCFLEIHLGRMGNLQKPGKGCAVHPRHFMLGAQKMPQKGIWIHSDSCSPLRTFTPQTHKAHSSDIYPIKTESKTLLPAVLGPGILSLHPLLWFAKNKGEKKKKKEKSDSSRRYAFPYTFPIAQSLKQRKEKRKIVLNKSSNFPQFGIRKWGHSDWLH